MSTGMVENSPREPEREGAREFIRCPECGAAGYPEDRFCSCCGESLGNRCGWCGIRIIHPVAYFCSQCGVPLIRQS
jgi:hypothetical protein